MGNSWVTLRTWDVADADAKLEECKAKLAEHDPEAAETLGSVEQEVDEDGEVKEEVEVKEPTQVSKEEVVSGSKEEVKEEVVSEPDEEMEVDVNSDLAKRLKNDGESKQKGGRRRKTIRKKAKRATRKRKAEM
jgi:hypothetical protein